MVDVTDLRGFRKRRSLETLDAHPKVYEKDEIKTKSLFRFQEVLQFNALHRTSLLPPCKGTLESPDRGQWPVNEQSVHHRHFGV
jgi:hypothetical protein